MPHLLETYALNCGAQINKPQIYEVYFPTPREDYITLQPQSRFSAKHYDFWDEVVDYIYEELKERNIKIVQLGGKDDRPIKNCVQLQGQTSINQAAYVVQNSIMHIGVDSFLCHVASAYQKKIVCLYSANYASAVRPYWTSSSNCVLLEPDKDEFPKPSFSLEELPKSINSITPEKVTEAVLKMLGISKAIRYKKLFAGHNYNNQNFQLIPTSVAQTEDDVPLAVRMDVEFNEEMLARQLNHSRCSIVTDRPINTALIKGGIEAKRIIEIVYFINEEHPAGTIGHAPFVDFIHKFSVPYFLMSRMTPEEITKIKLDYLDYTNINQAFDFNEAKKQIAEKSGLAEGDLTGVLFKSKKRILKDGKVFNSIFAMKNDLELESPEDYRFFKAADSDDFWNYIEDFYVAKKLD